VAALISRYAGRAGVKLAHAGRLHRLAARYAGGSGVILRLQRVRPPRPEEFTARRDMEVSPGFLAGMIERIRGGGVDLVGLDEGLARLADPGARRFCVLTFDGGYRDFEECALPELKRHDVPFTLYVASAFVDRTAEPWWLVVERALDRRDTVAFGIAGQHNYFSTRTFIGKRRAFSRIVGLLSEANEVRQRESVRELAWRSELDIKALLDEELMDWPALMRIAADPLATIGAAGVHHVALAPLPDAQARAELRDGAKVVAAAVGARVRHVAFPYGGADDAGRRESALAKELGFDTAVTTRRGVLRAGVDAFALPRLTISGRNQTLDHVDMLVAGLPHGLRNRQ
jgi:peptidoglycan/xylan/chitin deacetylase (PgdA/CDA1 family)